MRVSSSAARGPPTRGNSRRAGVAQSVAQLSCKQQVRSSSPSPALMVASQPRIAAVFLEPRTAAIPSLSPENSYGSWFMWPSTVG